GVIAFTPTPVGRSVIAMVSVLLVVVSAIRFGLVVSTLGAVSISSMTACSFAFGFGMFGQFEEFLGRLTLFAYTTTLVAASLVITALLAERDAAARERLRAEHRYAQIFDGSPQAIWVHDPVDLNFLLVNQAAQRQYGWTLGELLTRNVSVLAPPGVQHVLPGREPGTPIRPDASPFDTRHLTKDGRVLEVEVWIRSIDLGGRPAELVFAVDVSDRRTFDKALVDALAGEQRRIAREIHDGLGQELTGLALSLRALATRAERSRQPGAADLDDLAKLAAHCIEGSKRIVQGLSPLNDAGGSLEAALDALARRASLSGTVVRFRATGAVPLSVNTETLDHFYRIAQEAVQNALTHAAASSIEIELRSDSPGIQLSIVDDGRGLPADIAERKGLGMRTMHFRARAIGGNLSIETRAGGGVAVRCEAPRANTMVEDGRVREPT
ncbi:MAG: two-component system, LuxR family, sensor kinase FixL, partial [Gammaproteobacteria bacterium]|nr:two-component system, LuxR family, sensor kinase FixL [Gammaproteobacteria bacterium]